MLRFLFGWVVYGFFGFRFLVDLETSGLRLTDGSIFCEFLWFCVVDSYLDFHLMYLKNNG